MYNPNKFTNSDFALEQLLPILETDMCLLGIDYGKKRIGLAISDVRKVISSNFTTLSNNNATQYLNELKMICDNENIGGIVIGLPLNMNGTEGPRCQATRSFAKKLSLAQLPTHAFWDERLSSSAAENVLVEANISRKKRRGIIDKVAANIILQTALDRLQHFKKIG